MVVYSAIHDDGTGIGGEGSPAYLSLSLALSTPAVAPCYSSQSLPFTWQGATGHLLVPSLLGARDKVSQTYIVLPMELWTQVDCLDNCKLPSLFLVLVCPCWDSTTDTTFIYRVFLYS